MKFLYYRRNEELDDKAVIKKLKLRVAELEREIATTREQTPTIQQVRQPFEFSVLLPVHSETSFDSSSVCFPAGSTGAESGIAERGG